MTAYLSIMLATIVISFIAIRIYRLFSGSVMLLSTAVPDNKVLTLSPADGQWRLKHQMGFVRPDRRTPNVKRPVARKVKTDVKPNIRKPWGW